MEINFEHREVPDFIIEEISALKKQIFDLLIPVYSSNDRRLFFSSLNSVVLQMTLGQFGHNEEAMNAIEKLYISFFDNYRTLIAEEPS